MESHELRDSIPPTRRGRVRREKIIDAATALFHRQGFHATSIDEIGAASGITGPGLYRHFSSKDELLLAVFDRIWFLLRGAIDQTEGLDPDEALDVLIDTHTTLALDQGQALMLLVRELRHVPEYYQRAAGRNDNLYTDTWAECINQLHPGLSLDEARDVARALMGLIGSGARDSASNRVSKERRRMLMRAMCRSSIEGLRFADAGSVH